MRKLLSLEFRKNRKSIFLYLAIAAAILFQFIGLIGKDYIALPGCYAVPVIGANLFTTHLLLDAILLYLVVKDFEAGIIKEYLYVGHSRKEIFTAKYMSLFIESSVIIFLTTAGMLLWKTFKNGYGVSISGNEVLFLLRVAVGNVVACILLCTVAMLCVIVVSNVLALGLYFLLVSIWDMVALFFIAKFEMPRWISVRYLVSCFYDGSLALKEYFTSIAVLLVGGVFCYMVAFTIFQRREYR